MAGAEARSVSDVAKEIEINRATLDPWHREANEECRTNKPFTGHGNSRDEEMAKLQKENVDLWETNEILKKEIVIFTQKIIAWGSSELLSVRTSPTDR